MTTLVMNRRLCDRFPFSSRLEVRRGARVEITEARAFDVSVSGFGFSVPSARAPSAAPLAIGDIISVSMPELTGPLEGAQSFEDVHFEIPAVVRHVTRATDGVWLIGAERSN